MNIEKAEAIEELLEKALTLCYDHSKLSPSASKRWMTCSGSPALIESLFICDLKKAFEQLSFPRLIELSKSNVELKELIDCVQNDNTSKYAAEGTVAHEICERCLTGSKSPQDFLGKIMQADGFTFTVRQEMVDACKVYTDYIENYIGNVGWIECRVEVKCSLEPLGIKGLGGGTSDCLLINYSDKIIDVIDYKHGSGVAVEVENNTQAMQYGLGALIELESKGEDISEWQVHLTIIQPRAYHKDGPIRSWTLSARALMTWGEDILEAAAKNTHVAAKKLKEGKIAEFEKHLSPSDDGCLFCPVKDCSARYARVTEAAMIDFKDIGEESETAQLPDPAVMTVEQKIKVMDHIDLIRSFLVAVEDRVKYEIDLGSSEYAGKYKLVRTNTQRKLDEDAFDEISSPLLDYIEEDDLYIRKRKSIGELENALKDKFRADKVKGFTKKVKQILDDVTYRPQGKLVVAPESDNRKEVAPSIVSDFEKLEN